VGVPDPRLDQLAELFSSQRTVPGQVEIRDIAGLIKGASTGAGMGNAFLSQIRGVQVVFHVVRCFSDQKIVHVE
ncbi:ychF, partial [Symbiodinium pilosum]